jgi:GNAT superfamily N-acetyltransferase
MIIQIKSCIRTGIDDINDRESGACIEGTIMHCEYDFELDDLVEEQIGEIVAYRIVGPLDELTLWADSISQDLCDAVIWLQELCQQEVDLADLGHYFFIEKVEIEPEWRGRGIALKAVAAFLDVFSREGFVFLKPAPLQMLPVPEEQRKQIEQLRQFWQGLGLNQYDSEANFLWSRFWYCPEALSGTEDVRP